MANLIISFGMMILTMMVAVAVFIYYKRKAKHEQADKDSSVHNSGRPGS